MTQKAIAWTSQQRAAREAMSTVYFGPGTTSGNELVCMTGRVRLGRMNASNHACSRPSGLTKRKLGNKRKAGGIANLPLRLFAPLLTMNAALHAADLTQGVRPLRTACTVSRRRYCDLIVQYFGAAIASETAGFVLDVAETSVASARISSGVRVLPALTGSTAMPSARAAPPQTAAKAATRRMELACRVDSFAVFEVVIRLPGSGRFAEWVALWRRVRISLVRNQ